MGSRYLTDLPGLLRAAGLIVVEVDGWQTRARGSGGFDGGRPNHVMAHHTASGPSSDGWPDVNYCTFGDDDAPLCNLYLERSGIVYVCAAGATNTNGSGHDPCGWTADDSMNSSAVGIEAGNGGTGEAWPRSQQDAYIAICAALCEAYAIPPARCHSHFEWAPGRKSDPAGPSDWAPSGMWNMAAFRADVAAGGGSPPEPPPAAFQEDQMFIARDQTTRKLWVGNGLEKATYSDSDAAYVVGMYAKSPSPLRDVGSGRAVDAVADVTDVSDRQIRMMGTSPG